MTTRAWRADRVISGFPGAVFAPGVVIVRGTTIIWAGPESAAPEYPPPVDLGDSTLLPGLIDGHVHLTFDASPDPAARFAAEPTEAELQKRALDALAAYLDCGVTTVRDLGSPGTVLVQLRERLGGGPYPRMHLSGSPLTTPGGHCSFLGGAVSGTAEALDLVHRLADAGTDTVKVMVSGGFMTSGSPPPWTSQFDASSLQAIVRAAHGRGLRVAAHAHGTEAITAALTAEVDSVEHASFVTADGGSRADDTVIARLAEAGVAVCPTVNVRMPELAGLLGAHRMPPVTAMHEAGVRIVAGTDAGIGQLPHHAFIGALEAMLWFGMPVDDVLAAATTGAAEALGIGNRTGRLAPGLDADLIACTGDPRRHLGVLRDLVLVLARGAEHRPRPQPPITPYQLAAASAQHTGKGER